MKELRVVGPYKHPGYLNFKMDAFDAFMRTGIKVAVPHYPLRSLHRFAYRYELPTIWKCKNEARLRFVEPVSISFDTFPDYAKYEVIPMIWDCWPRYYDKMEHWLLKHKIKTAIFTSRQEMDEMKRRLPGLNVMWCPEGIDTKKYGEGKTLADRNIDVLEFGRSVLGDKLKETDLNYVCTKVNGKFIFTNEELVNAMGDAKVTIALPRSITNPEIAEGVETLTQRYWECMLSRMVMVGNAPQELIDIIGYDPVIAIDENRLQEQITGIVDHIEGYQDLVDRNRAAALKYGDWELRGKDVMSYLSNIYYCL